ncbi:MAG TPA: sugar nucleotide-binding protein, partial [Pseudonocardia sp.]|nr:sugar nucleotide-binding protein [Pseudonocardia sp.]
GHRVVALAKPGTDPRVLPAAVELRTGDLADPVSLSAAVTPDIDAVVNLATPSGDAAVDSAATEALLAPLRGTGRALVYTSGVWVLGATGGRPVDETAPTDPIDIVGYRPRVEEQVLAAAGDGVRSVVVRPGVAHGRGGGIPALLVQLAAEHGAGLHVGEDAVRWPMVHVDDLADLFVLALDRAPAGAVLHGVAEPAVGTRELAHAAATAAGVTQVRPWPLDDARRALGRPFADALACDQTVAADRTRAGLGWAPRRPGAVTELTAGSYVLTTAG